MHKFGFVVDWIRELKYIQTDKIRSFKMQNTYIIVKFLSLALSNLVLDLINIVTNLAKPSLGQPIQQPYQT